MAQGQGHVTWGHEKSACITPDSLVYTLLQKKGNFRNVAFLLEKTVDVPGVLENNLLHACYYLYDLIRLIGWPYSHLDHQITCITYEAGETALSTKKVVTTFLVLRAVSPASELIQLI